MSFGKLLDTIEQKNLKKKKKNLSTKYCEKRGRFEKDCQKEVVIYPTERVIG